MGSRPYEPVVSAPLFPPTLPAPSSRSPPREESAEGALGRVRRLFGAHAALATTLAVVALLGAVGAAVVLSQSADGPSPASPASHPAPLSPPPPLADAASAQKALAVVTFALVVALNTSGAEADVVGAWGNRSYDVRVRYEEDVASALGVLSDVVTSSASRGSVVLQTAVQVDVAAADEGDVEHEATEVLARLPTEGDGKLLSLARALALVDEVVGAEVWNASVAVHYPPSAPPPSAPPAPPPPSLPPPPLSPSPPLPPPFPPASPPGWPPWPPKIPLPADLPSVVWIDSSPREYEDADDCNDVCAAASEPFISMGLCRDEFITEALASGSEGRERTELLLIQMSTICGGVYDCLGWAEQAKSILRATHQQALYLRRMCEQRHVVGYVFNGRLSPCGLHMSEASWNANYSNHGPYAPPSCSQSTRIVLDLDRVGQVVAHRLCPCMIITYELA
jgi:hypothetical protein